MDSLPESGLKNQLLYITERIYVFYAENPKFSRTLIKEILFLEGEHGKILDTQVMSLLDEISNLIEKAVSNGELGTDVNAQDGALAFWSFYFMVLLIGLKQPLFNIDHQLKIIETLIDNYFFKRG